MNITPEQYNQVINGFQTHINILTQEVNQLRAACKIVNELNIKLQAEIDNNKPEQESKIKSFPKTSS